MAKVMCNLSVLPIYATYLEIYITSIHNLYDIAKPRILYQFKMPKIVENT